MAWKTGESGCIQTGDEAEFVLNGKSLGRKPIEKLMASMDIPYKLGILEGVVYKDGLRSAEVHW